MTYVVALVFAVRNGAMFQEYVHHFNGVLAKYDGSIVAADETLEIKEGSCRPQRAWLLTFPSNEKAQNWYASPEYRAILPLRLDSCDTSLMFVHGFGDETGTGWFNA